MNNDVDIYERDLIGYGGQPPRVHWPGEANIAVNFVVNYEAGAERTVLNGDACSERFLSDMVGTTSIEGARCAQMESMYEYGSRAGFWRLRDIFVAAQMPVTVFGVALAMELNPAVVAAMQAAQWEIATHGYRWVDFQNVPMEEEQAQLQRAIETHTRVTGRRPIGHYIGRTSPNSARICALEGGFLYDSDSYADDLPYYTQPLRRYNGDAGYQLVLPYTLDVNDMKYVAYNGFTESQQFFQYLKDQFDVLYEEGERGQPKMMSIGLHARIAGKPARAAGLRRFVEYIQTKERVWVATRQAIAEHWLAHHPPPQATFYQRTHAAESAEEELKVVGAGSSWSLCSSATPMLVWINIRKSCPCLLCCLSAVASLPFPVFFFLIDVAQLEQTHAVATASRHPYLRVTSRVVNASLTEFFFFPSSLFLLVEFVF